MKLKQKNKTKMREKVCVWFVYDDDGDVMLTNNTNESKSYNWESHYNTNTDEWVI